MSETYPVLINGEKKGTLTVSREGLTTRFDAKCEDPGTLVRLSVYGGGKEGVSAYIDKIGSELRDAMKMCGVSKISEITRDCILK